MKERKNIVLLLGAVFSALPLISNIVRSLKYIRNYTAIPSAIIHQSLDLLSVRYFVNELLIHFLFAGIIGFVLLMIAYIESLPKRK